MKNYDTKPKKKKKKKSLIECTKHVWWDYYYFNVLNVNKIEDMMYDVL